MTERRELVDASGNTVTPAFASTARASSTSAIAVRRGVDHNRARRLGHAQGDTRRRHCLQVEDCRPAWDQHKVGELRRAGGVLLVCGAVSMIAKSIPAASAFFSKPGSSATVALDASNLRSGSRLSFQSKALPCGSRSMIATRCPCIAAQHGHVNGERTFYRCRPFAR